MPGRKGGAGPSRGACAPARPPSPSPTPRLASTLRAPLLEARFLHLLRFSGAAGAALSIATYLFVAGSRLAYPFDLEWEEGGVVEHCRRVREGLPLYPPPSLEFAPYVYPPLYFVAGAAAMGVVGVGPLGPRLVSFAASLGCLALLYALARRATGRRFPGLLAAGLYAASFRLCGGWFDLARVDSLFLFFSLLGTRLLLRAQSPPVAALAGLALALAFLAKQQGALFAATLAVAAFRAGLGKGLLFSGTFAVLAGGFTVAANLRTEGWYAYYVFAVPAGHETNPGALLGFWVADLWRAVPLLLGFALHLAGRRDPEDEAAARAPVLAYLGAGLLASWSSRLHTGGFDNVLMPAISALALAAGVGWGRLRLATGDSPRKRALEGTLLALLLVQFLVLAYDPRRQVPTRADREAGERIVRLLRDEPGEVFVPNHGHLTFQAGKPPHAQWMGIRDLLRSSARAPRDEGALEKEIDEAFAARRFGLVVLDGLEEYWTSRLEGRYRDAGRAIEEGWVFLTRSGARMRPEYLFRPQ